MPTNDTSELCSNCGKPIRDLRDGSMTGWIFGGSSCSCHFTEAMRDAIAFPFQSVSESDSVADSQEGTTGRIIDERYELLEQIARGSIGFIYRGRDIRLDRPLAVKLLRAEYREDLKARQSFEKEARACARLYHPNLQPILDFGVTEDGVPYLVMDYLEGTNLQTLLDRQKGLPEEQAVRLLIQVATGLSYAHDNGVIHRDVKPENIVVTQEGTSARLIDFSVAKLEDADGEYQRYTQTGEIFGSPSYMSPEQCRGKDVTPRSDIYSLGCVMYTILTGVRPFRGENVLATLDKQINDQPKPFSEARPDLRIDPVLERITLTCMEKDPQKRFESASDLAGELKEVINRSFDKQWKRKGLAVYAAIALAAISLLTAGVVTFAALSAESTASSSKKAEDTILERKLLTDTLMAMYKDEYEAEEAAKRLFNKNLLTRGASRFVRLYSADRLMKIYDNDHDLAACNRLYSAIRADVKEVERIAKEEPEKSDWKENLLTCHLLKDYAEAKVSHMAVSEAESFFRRSIRIGNASKENFWYTGSVKRQLARLLESDKRYKDAKKWFREALADNMKAMEIEPERDYDAAKCANSFGNFYHRQRKYEEAIEYYKLALDVYKRKNSEFRKTVRSNMKNSQRKLLQREKSK